jgi:hypothetical protein
MLLKELVNILSWFYEVEIDINWKFKSEKKTQ